MRTLQDLQNRTIEVQVTASNGWNIATLHHKIEYTGDPETFIQAIRDRTFICGYTAVLHYDDELNYARICVENKPLFEAILSQYADLQWYKKRYDELRYIVKGAENHDQDWVERHIRYALQDESIEIRYNERSNCWMADNWSEDRLWQEMHHIKTWMDGVKTVLEGLGCDPEDNEKKRRICENMGLYRVNMSDHVC